MAVALAQEGAFGFGLQTAKGTYVAPSVWLPLMAGAGGHSDTLRWQKNYVTLDMADHHEYESKYYSAGEWAEGKLTVPLVPGALTALLSWVQDRDADSQGKWASLVVDCVNEVKKVTDAKVRRMVLDFAKGQPVMCTLEVAALKMEGGNGGSARSCRPQRRTCTRRRSWRSRPAVGRWRTTWLASGSAWFSTTWSRTRPRGYG